LDGGSGDLGACAGFTSLAKKNFESPELDCAKPFALPTSDTAGLKETVGRFGASFATPDIPSPEI
jgi:hypothetical protein